jgi:hypothetical protein
MVHDCPNKWSQWLALAEYWYNTTPHSTHGKTPFQVLYGHAPRHFGISDTSQCTVPDLEQWLRDREAMYDIIQHNLTRDQVRMKAQADKNRQEREFAVGDWVYLKLQPYIQQSVARRSNHKLSFKFFGPYMILDKVGKVAYKLQLPATSQIHPVIHVSQLKKALPPASMVSPDDDLACIHSTSSGVPLQVTKRRLQRVGNKLVPVGKVSWSLLPASWTTWENLNILTMQFPGLPLVS